MKSFFISLSAFFLLLPAGYAQIRYPSDSIPPLLRIGADAVVRSYQKKLTILDENNAYIDYKLAVTLLNENAESYNYVPIRYTDLTDVSMIRASAYDENGKQVWTLKKDEILDIKDFSGPEYLDGSRVKVFKFPSYNYPYTIDYSFRLSTEDLLLNPVDYFATGTSVSVEKAGIQCIIPRNIPFRYSTRNMKSPTDSVWVKNKLILTWQEEYVQAQKQRTFAPAVERTLPALYTTTEKINLKGYAGDLSTWKSYGTWVGKIIEGRDALSSEYADEVLALVKNVPDSREKIRILYEYMQKKTRYFSITFGIGGDQPIPADQVAKNGYGDCKALSNYMKALLKVAGIESYYTLVNAGAGENIEPGFPGSQFNHAILCVPDKMDTIWLECTNQTAPFGYLGSFTSDRYVLVVTPEGGKIQRTPAYDKNDNVINSSTEIILHGSGDADVKIKLHQTGLFYERIKEIFESKEDRRKDMLASLIGFTAFNVKKEEYSFGKTRVPYGSASFDIRIRDLSAKSSNRLYISPSLLSRFSYIWEDPADIELSTSYQRNDTVRIEIPIGYKIEYLPDAFRVDARFGKYATHISSDYKYIYYTRILEINGAVYPKESYPEFYNFISEIAENDSKMLIIKSVY